MRSPSLDKYAANDFSQSCASAMGAAGDTIPEVIGHVGVSAIQHCSELDGNIVADEHGGFLARREAVLEG
jgi:hypothetical protein